MKKRTNILAFRGFNPSHSFHAFYVNVYDFLGYLAKEILQSLVRLKASWQPWIDKIKNAIKGVISFVSTLKTSFQVMPVVLSTLTVLSAAPLFQHILPSFLLEPIVIIPTLLAISLYAGYSTYKDLITRAELDKQIEENQRINTGLVNKLAALEKKLEKISKGTIQTLDKASSTNQAHYFLRRNDSKTPSKSPAKLTHPVKRKNKIIIK